MLSVKNYIVSILVLLFCTQIGFAQTYNEGDSNEETITKNDIDISRSIFSDFGIGTGANPRNSQISGNSVFLTQIGAFNTTSIITETNASEITVSQNGDENNVELTYVANTAIADLTQNGDFNVIKDFVVNENEDISLDLIQDGDDLLFLREGVNSLTKSLKYRQSEASPTIIIRSN